MTLSDSEDVKLSPIGVEELNDVESGVYAPEEMSRGSEAAENERYIQDKQGGRYSLKSEEYTSETGAEHVVLEAVYNADNKVVGSIHFYTKKDLQGEEVGAIQDIGVDKNYRRRGIAGKLLEKAEAALQANGIGKIVAALSNESVPLFVKNGYNYVMGPEFNDFPGVYCKNLNESTTFPPSSGDK